jgi:hypothetical protein
MLGSFSACRRWRNAPRRFLGSAGESSRATNPQDRKQIRFRPVDRRNDTRHTAKGSAAGAIAAGDESSMTAKVCVIATVRADVRDTIGFVNYHLNSGIEEIILFLDDPADPAAHQLSGYANVRPIRCDAAYWAARGVEAPSVTQERQEINVNHGMKLAAERGFDWIIHIDGDELLLADGDINTILSEQSADVVRFALKEAVAEKNRYETIFEATLFRESVRLEKLSRMALADILNCQAAFFEGEYIRGHSASKVAVRLNAKIEWMGIHGPLRPRIAEVETNRIVLLHFDCIGIADWKTKWARRLDHPGAVERLRSNRRRQMELFRHVYGNAAAELALYSRLHKIPERQKSLLMQHGLLSVVTLPSELFERPKSGDARVVMPNA